MIFLGVDQSLTGTGIALVHEDRACVGYRTIITGKLRGAARLDMIRREIARFIDASPAPITAAAMEGGSFKSIHRGFDLGAVFGVVQADLYARGIDPCVVPPLLVKKFATGNAFAKKDAIIKAVKAQWGVTCDDDNQADAVVLAQIALALFLPKAIYTRHSAEVIATLTKTPSPRGATVRIRTKNLVNL